MLEGLDSIPWATLEHAYGSASDVPDLIRALNSPDSETRDKTYWTLYGNIFHQGSRYEATPYAVPFLFELLHVSNTPDRHRLVSLLVNLALGYEEEFLPFGFDAEEYYQSLETDEAHEKLERARAIGLFYGDEESEEDETEENDEEDTLSGEEWDELYAVKTSFGMQDTYRAVEAQLLEMLPLLETSELLLRLHIVYALAWFPKHAEVTLPIIRRVAAEADIPFERAHALPVLGILARASGDRSDFPFLLSALKDPEPLVQQFAAIALTTLLESETPTEALSLLMEATAEEDEDDNEEETEAPEILWNEGDLPGYAAVVLETAAKGREEQILTSLCAGLEGAPPLRSLKLTGAMLRLVFPEGKFQGESAATLTPLQRQALEAIAQHGAWKVGKGDFANYSLLINAFNLPSDQKKMQDFLSSP